MISHDFSSRIAELRETFARITVTHRQAMRLRATAAQLRREAGALRCDTARLSNIAGTASAALALAGRPHDTTATGDGADLA